MKRIRITTQQLKTILKVAPAKYPLLIFMKGIEKAEMEEIVELLKKKD